MTYEDQIECLKYILGKAYRADRKKKKLDERLAEIREKLKSPIEAINYGQVSGGGFESEGSAKIPLQIADIESRIIKQQEEIKQALTVVMDILELLPIDSIEREICEMRHIDGRSFTEIAEEIPMSRSQVNVRYNIAINALLTRSSIQNTVEVYEEEYLTWKINRDIMRLRSQRRRMRSS